MGRKELDTTERLSLSLYWNTAAPIRLYKQTSFKGQQQSCSRDHMVYRLFSVWPFIKKSLFTAIWEITTKSTVPCDFSKKSKWKLLSHVWLFVTPWTIQSMEFSRLEYWNGLPFPSPGDHPNPGIKPRSPALQEDSLSAEPEGKPKNTGVGSLSLLQRIFPTQESNWGLLHCGRILYQLSYQGRLDMTKTLSNCQLMIGWSLRNTECFITWLKPLIIIKTFYVS